LEILLLADAELQKLHAPQTLPDFKVYHPHHAERLVNPKVRAKKFGY
jgi:hypothetical protein